MNKKVLIPVAALIIVVGLFFTIRQFNQKTSVDISANQESSSLDNSANQDSSNADGSANQDSSNADGSANQDSSNADGSANQDSSNADGSANQDSSSVDSSANQETGLKQIGLQDSLTQKEESYYLYFYKSDCPYCDEVEDMISKLNKIETVYTLNCDAEENRGNKYDWTIPMHDLKAIGFINDQGEREYYDNESEEKYINIDEVNKFGNKIYYKVDSMTDVDGGEQEVIYTKMVTPEIDYSIVETWEDITIAGVPTLLRVTNGKIDKFYFDSPDINAMNLE